MKHAILEKIGRTLNEPLNEEKCVSYLLAEIRKYLELTREPGFQKLWLFCNWALHSEVTARRVVTEADEYLQKCFSMGMSENDVREFERILNLGDFRDDLRAFLQSQGLPTAVCEDEPWIDFISVYARIVEDCPLTLTGSPGPNAMVDQLVVSVADGSKAKTSPSAADFFPMDWEFFKDGSKRGTLHLRPQGSLLGSTIEWNGSPFPALKTP
jgi:hypothetical protein